LGTLNAIYVHVPNLETAEALRAGYSSAYTEPNMEFYAIEDPPCGYRAPEAELRDLSRRLATDVIWLGFQSLVDAFQYHHWRTGDHVRSLVFGCFGEERTWEKASGQPESWERDALFSDEDLAFWLSDATELEKREYERIWRNTLLLPGQTVPSLDARETARKVAEYYRLPGWGLEDEAPS